MLNMFIMKTKSNYVGWDATSRDQGFQSILDSHDNSI